MSKRIVIIGAGPAGLTAALEYLSRNPNHEVVVLEASERVGGLAKTLSWNGNRFDIGGHRFFSTDSRVRDWWNSILPMLEIERHSSIYFRGHYLDYPIKFSADTIHKLGSRLLLQICWSYLRTHSKKATAKSLEDFFIARFGEKLYRLFFHDYSKKVWGREPSQISPDWGPERIEGISLRKIVIAALTRRSAEPSLTDRFYYPNQGAGVFWEAVAERIKQQGGQILINHEVKQIRLDGDSIVELICDSPSGNVSIRGDEYVSTMPLQDLCIRMTDIAQEALSVARRLQYRDMIVAAVLLDKSRLTKASLPLAHCKEQWIYVQDKDISFGRIQIVNNWSDSMLKAPDSHILLVLEYFCQVGDRLWELDNSGWKHIIQEDLQKAGLLADEQAILDYMVRRIMKAYPCYWDGYKELDIVYKNLEKIKNLICIGRNGRHQYRNMDDVILEAMRSVDL